MPSHVVLELLVLNKLREQNRDYTVAIELPYDSVFKKFTQHTGKPRQTSIQPAIDDRNPRGNLSLKTAIVWQDYLAPLSHDLLWHYILNSRINTIFNDSSAYYRGIDFSDPETARYRSALGYDDHTTMSRFGVPGVHLRNRMMVDKILTRPGLVIQICGYAHVYGMKSPYHPYEYSLTALLKDSGCPVLAAPFLSNPYHGLLPENDPALIGGIHPIQTEESINEVEILTRLLHASDMDTAIPEKALIESLRREMLDIFDHWNRQLPAGPSP